MRSSFLHVLAAGALAFGPAIASAQSDTISTSDRARIVRDLEQSNQHFQAAVHGLTPAQWTFKPGPTRWSIAEVAEHLTLVEQGIGGMVRDGGVKPMPVFTPDSAAKLEAAVRGLYGDRTHKMSSPEGFVPTGRWATQAELMSAYDEARRSNLEYIRTTKDPLRARGTDHAAFGGPIDATHWLVVIGAHMERHLQQIEEVKRAEGYPK
jgi:hypothetical protein